MIRIRISFLVAAALALAPAFAGAEEARAPSKWAKAFPDWVRPHEPFRVIGNIHYVGSEGLGVYLIAGSKGHILLDGGLPETAPIIAANIEALGFKLSDVKILLNTHAHFDHSGGLAALKEATGAKLLAHEGDRSALEGGFYLGSERDESVGAPPVAVDETVEDGETVRLGDIEITARHTPGHTRGCTSWTMSANEAGADYEVLFFCGASVALNRLVASDKGPVQYDGIVEDYRRTFETARDWRPDVFLAEHASLFNMKERRARQKAGDPRAFVDRDAFQTVIDALEADFEKKLAAQREAAGEP